MAKKNNGKSDQLRAMREASAGGGGFDASAIRKSIEDAIAPHLQSRTDKLAKLMEEKRSIEADIAATEKEIDQIRAAAGLGGGKRAKSGGGASSRSQEESDKRAVEIMKAENANRFPLRHLNSRLVAEGYRKTGVKALRAAGLKIEGTLPALLDNGKVKC